MIKAIAGVVPSFSGEIQTGGKSLRGIRPDQLGEFGISYVPQTENIFRNLSVKRNIELILGLAAQKHSGQFEELMNLFLLYQKTDSKGKYTLRGTTTNACFGNGLGKKTAFF